MLKLLPLAQTLAFEMFWKKILKIKNMHCQLITELLHTLIRDDWDSIN